MTATAAVRDVARRLNLGRAALMLYHQPVGLFRKSVAEGGPLEQRRTEQGRREMMEAATSMPPLVPPLDNSGARVAFLSGAPFWYQTLFCFASLQLRVSERITPVIYDDGTFTSEIRAFIRRVVSWVEFVDHEFIECRLDQILPSASYPNLRARRSTYLHLRKLTDVHVCSEYWTLVLDSDMLFFRQPDAMLSWFRRPRGMFMQDVQPSYGYSETLMAELARGPVPERVNVGLYAIHSSSIDWDLAEHACRIQLERKGSHYLQEQALTALLLAGTDAEPLPLADYVVMPSLAEGRDPTAILHHYVAHSKRSYFQHGWRRVMAQLERLARSAART